MKLSYFTPESGYPVTRASWEKDCAWQDTDYV